MARYKDEILMKNGKVSIYVSNSGWDNDLRPGFCWAFLEGFKNQKLTQQERLEILNFMIDRLTKWRDEERKEQLIEELAELK